MRAAASPVPRPGHPWHSQHTSPPEGGGHTTECFDVTCAHFFFSDTPRPPSNLCRQFSGSLLHLLQRIILLLCIRQQRQCLQQHTHATPSATSSRCTPLFPSMLTTTNSLLTWPTLPPGARRNASTSAMDCSGLRASSVAQHKRQTLANTNNNKPSRVHPPASLLANATSAVPGG